MTKKYFYWHLCKRARFWF